MSRHLAPDDVLPLLRLADRAVSRLCTAVRVPPHEREDIRQDLLLDFLARLKFYDPAQGTLAAFAVVCFQHRAVRLAERNCRERRLRHPMALDAPVPGTVGLTVADSLADADGFGAWWGQSTDGYAAVDRRLDLNRALGTLPPAFLRICAVLTASEADPVRAAGLPRTTFYRRVHEVRCHMLAAGVSVQRGTDHRVRG